MVKTLVLLVSFIGTSILMIATMLSITRERQESNLAAHIETHPTTPTPSTVPPTGTVWYSTLPLPSLSPEKMLDPTLSRLGGFGTILSGSDEDVLATSSATQSTPLSSSPSPKSSSKLKTSPTPTPSARPLPILRASPSSLSTISASLSPSRQQSIRPLVITLPIEATPLPQQPSLPTASRRGLIILGAAATVLALVGMILLLKR